MHKKMTNREVAELLRDVAASYEIQGKDFFRIRAYDNAADAVENSNVEIKDLWEQKKLQTLSGIGGSIAAHLDELFSTGESKHFKKVVEKIPESIYKLRRLPGVGPKTAAKLVQKLNLTNPDTILDDIISAAESGRVAKLEGFGEKSQKDLIDSVNRYRRKESKEERMTLPFAGSLADKILEYMRKNKKVKKIEVLGSLRRRTATVGDIDLAVVCEKKNSKEVIKHFKNWPEAKQVLAAGKNTARLLHFSGAQIDLKTSKEETFGSMLQHFTGSKEHNIALREYVQKRGLSLSEYGIKQTQKHKNTKTTKQLQTFYSEERFYRALGMGWIPPELRENRGEIEAALNKNLPKLVEKKDIKGDLHIHSDFDITPSHDLGTDSMKDIIDKAIELGYQFIGFAEHSPANKLSNNKKLALIKARNKQIEQLLGKYENLTELRVFKLLEVDILAEGKLPLTNRHFDELDAAIVSIHSSFRQNTKRITKRIIDGLSHPKAKILGHPTGRLLQKREGVDADWTRIYKFAALKNKALEINGYPDRLDLPDEMCREAKKYGVKFVIGTDSHNVKSMHNMKYGVSVARRGWLEKGDVLNTMDVVKFEKWLTKYGRW